MPNSDLTQTDYSILILAIQTRIQSITNDLLNNMMVVAALNEFPDLQVRFQTAIGATVIDEHTALLTKLQTLEPLAPTS